MLPTLARRDLGLVWESPRRIWVSLGFGARLVKVADSFVGGVGVHFEASYETSRGTARR
jgi:hypothetical protein